MCEIDIVVVATEYETAVQKDFEGVNNRFINLIIISLLSREELTSRSPSTYLASNVKRTKKLRLDLP